MQSTDYESWIPVEGYEGFYEVSDQGRVRAVERVDVRGQHRHAIIRKPTVSSHGHPIVSLNRDRTVVRRPVAHLVLTAFVGSRPSGGEADHLDGNTLNNTLTNLAWRKRTRRPRQERICEADDCRRKVRAHGYCGAHDRRSRLYGDPLAYAPKASSEERFWSRVQPTGFCWEWTRGHDSNGYGCFSPEKGVSIRTHRYAYELLVGPIPEGLEIDHLCRNRNCCNPDHLEPVTSRENARRAYSPTRLAADANVAFFPHADTLSALSPLTIRAYVRISQGMAALANRSKR